MYKNIDAYVQPHDKNHTVFIVNKRSKFDFYRTYTFSPNEFALCAERISSLSEEKRTVEYALFVDASNFTLEREEDLSLLVEALKEEKIFVNILPIWRDTLPGEIIDA